MKKFVSLALATLSCPALAAEPPLDRLVGCAEIPDAPGRLACFDREVAPLASARKRPPVPAVAPAQASRTPATPGPAAATAPPAAPTVLAPAPTPPPARSFGDEQLQRKDRAAAPEEEQSLHARIERLRTVTASDFIVYLDNGQAWRHQDQTLGAYLRQGEAITISRGALGSYRLTRDAGNSKNWIRVTRIK
jgi:hypothetical protein